MNPQTNHPRLFRDGDADPSLLRGKTIAILGYGLLGQPLAQNLRDAIGSGPNPARVIVGSDDGSSSLPTITRAGLGPDPMASRRFCASGWPRRP